MRKFIKTAMKSFFSNVVVISLQLYEKLSPSHRFIVEVLKFFVRLLSDYKNCF